MQITIESINSMNHVMYTISLFVNVGSVEHHMDNLAFILGSTFTSSLYMLVHVIDVYIMSMEILIVSDSQEVSRIFY